jgi:serine/threonine-protein kinase
VREGNLLYELYSGNLDNGELDAFCLAVWDLNVVYPPEGRGEHCTSADAAGFPIAALLPNADEIAAAVLQVDADLGHAIRFILPNNRMASFPDGPDSGTVRDPLYVRPASHAGGPVGPEASVPYGARLRLRSDFDMTGYNAAAQVVLRTMQRYGIVLADGGNIALTFESDRHTTASWASLGLDDSQIFWTGAIGNRTPVAVTDFVVIDTGSRIAETYDCVRSAVVPGDAVFTNGFEGN